MSDRFARVLAMIAVALSAIAVMMAWYGVQQIQDAREELQRIAETFRMMATEGSRTSGLHPPPLEIERDSN